MTPSISKAVLRLLARYRETGGVSADYITKEPNFHPMAEAKYLSTCVQLCRDRLMPKDELTEVSLASVSRLEAAALARYEGSYSWGLGFAWLDRPASEPYLITSSLCTQALLEAAAETAHPAVCRVAELAVNGLAAWVTSDRVPADRSTIPAYSPAVRIPIYNPGAHAAGTVAYARSLGIPLSEEASTFPEQMLQELERIRIPDIGWPYSTSRGVSDLVHINYILHPYLALLPIMEVEKVFLPIVGQHVDCRGVSDRVRILGTEDQFTWGSKVPRQTVVRRAGVTWYAIDRDPAMLWGAGELLLNAGRLARQGSVPGYWTNVISLTLNSFNADATSLSRFCRFHRHTMHLAHGLAMSLRSANALFDPQGLGRFLEMCISD